MSSKHFPVLMIVGMGNLGTHVLDMMTKIPHNQIKIVITGRDEDLLSRKRNMALLTASQFGLYPEIEYAVMDLTDVTRVAEVINQHKPDLIFNTASIQSWRKVTELPREMYKAIDKAGLGPWLPMHLPLVYRLSKAIKLAGSSALFVNAAFPDVVNPSLHKIGLAPAVGIGNIANAVPGIRCSIGAYLQRPMHHVDVQFVAHHFISHHVSRHGYPNPELFHLTVTVDGTDVTRELDLQQIFNDIPVKFKRMVGIEGQPMTAASAIKVLMAALYNTNALVHAPGPNGLPGGYPVRVRAKGVTVDLPASLSQEEAVAINEKSQLLEGISKIDADGTVHFNPKNMQVLKDLLGYECKNMKIEESYEIAMELKQKYTAFAQKHR